MSASAALIGLLLFAPVSVLPLDAPPDAVPVTGDGFNVPPGCVTDATVRVKGNLSPVATGTVRYFPEFGILEPAPVGTAVQSSYFRTTPENRESRRGFIEFGIPRFNANLNGATLVLSETRGWTSHPMPPDLHELSYYAADLTIKSDDYVRSTTPLTTFETDPNEDTKVFSFDVTEAVLAHEGRCLGFRVKLEADAQMTFMGWAGSEFGSLDVDHELRPRLEFDWSGSPPGFPPTRTSAQSALFAPF